VVDEARQAFQEESTELLTDMEEALLLLENEPDNQDAINAVFRAAHTIKGTGGVFGFDDVEAFTHIAENVLDEIRAGSIAISGDLIAVLLKSRDHMGLLVEAAVEDGKLSDEEKKNGEILVIELKNFLGIEEAKTDEKMSSADVEQVKIENTCQEWIIKLSFGENVLRDGMDPLSFLRYLTKQGDIVDISTITSRIPNIKDLDPESCFLDLVVTFQSDTSTKDDIEKVFEFVKDDCELEVVGPISRDEKNIEAIEELSDDISPLGTMLIETNIVNNGDLENILSEQEKIRKSQDIAIPKLGEMLVKKGIVEKNIVDAALNKQEVNKRKAASRQLRVDADKLDELINLVGELVISGATTNVLAQKSGDRNLLETVSSMSHLVEEIRDSALRLRMVQIGETFNRFQRVVRDVSRDLGKDIRLELNGGETELDKMVVEKIGDPLMHLVRNAMDHGIEVSEEREKNNKETYGTLKLNAYHDSGSIVIQVIDDGRGLDADKIFAKAIEKGIIDKSASLTEKEIFRLIFEAGFSTAAEITNLSGRGVGMDVVKKNIESLRGNVDVDSVTGEGTTINIRLPLTLAIIDGFLVEVDESTYVIPLDMVEECIELNEEGQELTVQNNYVNLRGKVLPIMHLRTVFESSSETTKRENIVVVQVAGQTAGLVVDELLGEFQTVIKPLGKIFQNLECISGSTILGSGDVAAILDVPGLVQKATRQIAGINPRHLHSDKPMTQVTLH